MCVCVLTHSLASSSSDHRPRHPNSQSSSECCVCVCERKVRMNQSVRGRTMDRRYEWRRFDVLAAHRSLRPCLLCVCVCVSLSLSHSLTHSLTHSFIHSLTQCCVDLSIHHPCLCHFSLSSLSLLCLVHMPCLHCIKMLTESEKKASNLNGQCLCAAHNAR